MEGWIKLHRKLLDWEWYDDINVFRLFIHCVLKANHNENNWRGIKVNRGCFITSYDKLAKELQLTPMKIRTAIKKLIVTNEITIKTTSQFTIIQIVKYSDYQADNKHNNKRITNKQQTDNNQITTNKNDKKDNNEKNDNNITDEFDKFWNLYDKKVGSKEKCLIKFKKLKNEEIEEIFSTLTNYIKSTPDKKFRKNPETYLNNKSWNDEIIDNASALKTDIKNPNSFKQEETKYTSW